MTEESLADQLLRGLGNLIPEERKQQLREQAEKVARESAQGFEQLKHDVEEMVAKSKVSADEALTHLESAFTEFQTNMETARERRRKQTDDVYEKLQVVLDKLQKSDVMPQMRTELEQRTDSVMKSVKKCGDKLSKEVLDQVKALQEAYNGAAEKSNRDLRAAICSVLDGIPK